MIVTKLKFTGTDEEIRNAIITHVIERLAHAHTFGCYTKDDIAQQSWVIALEVLDSGKYDINLPMEKFLYSHLRNRLKNLYRDKCWRKTRPNENPETWAKRTRQKSSLMNTAELTDNRMDSHDPTAEIAAQDLSIFIHNSLPEEMRHDYLKLINDEPLVETTRKELRELIQEILINGD